MNFFNPESSEDTRELEDILSDQAISTTVYDKSWVLQIITSLFISQIDDSDDQLQSLVQMSENVNVAKFLITSGCLCVMCQCLVEGNFSCKFIKMSVVIVINVIEAAEILLDHDLIDQVLRVAIFVIITHSQSEAIGVAVKLANILCYKLSYLERPDEMLIKITSVQVLDNLAYVLACSCDFALLASTGELLRNVLRLGKDSDVPSVKLLVGLIEAMSHMIHLDKEGGFEAMQTLISCIVALPPISPKDVDESISVKLCDVLVEFIVKYRSLISSDLYQDIRVIVNGNVIPNNISKSVADELAF